MRTENSGPKFWLAASAIPVLGLAVCLYQEIKLNAILEPVRPVHGSTVHLRWSLNRQKTHLHIVGLIQNLFTIAAIATLLALGIIQGNLYMGLSVGAGLLTFASMLRHSFKILKSTELSKAIRKQWVLENIS
jgi:hypothetical protein